MGEVLFRVPTSDVGVVCYYTVVKGVGYGNIVPIPDPLYHLLTGSMHIEGDNPSTELRSSVDRNTKSPYGPIQWETHSISYRNKPKNRSSKDLIPMKGGESWMRYSLLGPRASINYAYVDKQKFVEHLDVHGVVHPTASYADSVIDRDRDLFVELAGHKIYGIRHKMWRSDVLPTIVSQDANTFQKLGTTWSNPAPTITVHRGGYGTFANCLTDTFQQLVDIGTLDFGADGAKPPAFGNLGPITGYSRLLSISNFRHERDGTTLVLRWTIDTWQCNSSVGRAEQFDVEMAINEELYVSPPSYAFSGSHNTATSYRWSTRTAEWHYTFDGDSHYWEFQGTNEFPAPDRSFVTTSECWPLRVGTLHNMRPKKRKVFHDLIIQAFLREAQDKMDSAAVINKLYDSWVTAVEDAVKQYTDTNLFETVGDLKELQGLIPPLDYSKLQKGDLVSRFKALWDFVSAAGLYHNFVFSPTIGEIETYTKAVQSYIERARAKSFSAADLYVDSIVRLTVDEMRVTASFHSRWAPPNFSSVYEALGRDILRQASLGNLYDLIKFSWLLDYVSNVGDTIGRIDAFIHNINAWPLYNTVSHRMERTYDPNELYTFIPSNLSARWKGEVTLTNFVRDVRLRPLTPKLELNIEPSFTPSRFFNAIAALGGLLFN